MFLMFIPTNILVWIVVGGGAGVLAGFLVKGTGLGILADIVVGILGALLGGFLMSLIGHAGFTGFNLWSLVVSFIGAVILLALVRVVGGGRRTARA
jgi:uncharacterized membrane protein YeaQ/YmgE (transglycosylase-associated protein family)